MKSVLSRIIAFSYLESHWPNSLSLVHLIIQYIIHFPTISHDVGNIFLRNVNIYLHGQVALHDRRQMSTNSLPRESQISYGITFISYCYLSSFLSELLKLFSTDPLVFSPKLSGNNRPKCLDKRFHQ